MPRKLFLPICLLLLLWCVSRLPAQEQPVVKKIDIEGLKRYSPDLVLAKMQTKVGKSFVQDTLIADIHRLYATGFFSDINWEQSEYEGGVRILLRFRENEVIEEVVFQGLKEFKVSEIEEHIKVNKFENYAEHFIKQDRDYIKEKYLEKGYHFVEVEARSRAGTVGVVIEYIVREGPRVLVGTITLNGTQQVDPDDVLDVMKTEEDAWYTSHAFNRRTLDEDVERIKLFYRSEGYLDVDAKLENVVFSPDKTGVDITIWIDEGSKYFVHSIAVKGNTLFSSSDIESRLKLAPAKPFKFKDLDRDVRTIKMMYGEKAYVQTEVKWDYKIAEPGKAAVSFDIVEKDKTIVGKIEIRGNTRTKDKVIRRDILLAPTEDWNVVKLDRSLQRLQAKRYFDEISFSSDETPNPAIRDLICEVTEGSTGSLRFGAGFSSNVGILGLVEFQQRNFDLFNTPESFEDLFSGDAFTGAGQHFRVFAQPGDRRSSYGLSFREPYIYEEYPLGFDLAVSFTDRELNTYDEKRTSTGLGFDYRFETGWVVGLGFSFDFLDISDMKPGLSPWIQELEGSSELFSLVPSVSYDKRNDILFPTEGYRVGLVFENAGLMGGDYDFHKAVITGEWYNTLFTDSDGGKHVLLTDTRIGWAEAYSDTDHVPVFERFYAGGTGSVRGFEYRTISPRENDEPVGGEGLFTFTTEYSFPIYRTEFQDRHVDVLRLAFFVDGGNAPEDWSDMTLGEMRYGAGLGIRFTIPQLGPIPLSIDVGFPIRKEDDDDEQMLHFNIGYYP